MAGNGKSYQQTKWQKPTQGQTDSSTQAGRGSRKGAAAREPQGRRRIEHGQERGSAAAPTNTDTATEAAAEGGSEKHQRKKAAATQQANQPPPPLEEKESARIGRKENKRPKAAPERARETKQKKENATRGEGKEGDETEEGGRGDARTADRQTITCVAWSMAAALGAQGGAAS